MEKKTVKKTSSKTKAATKPEKTQEVKKESASEIIQEPAPDVKPARRSKGGPPRLARPVLQYSLTGEFIREYNMVGDAAAAVGGYQPNITACCMGKQKKAYGYIWRYKGDDVSQVNRLCTGVVRQYTLDGEFLFEYRSAKEAARKMVRVLADKKLNVIFSGIFACCKGHTTKAYGYQWRFKDDVGNLSRIPAYRRVGSKGVIQYSKEGKVIGRYNSVVDAVKEGLGLEDEKKIESAKNNINNNCKRRHLTGEERLSYDFYWSYEEDEDPGEGEE